MKTITHAQLVEASPFRVGVIDREGDRYTLAITKNGTTGQRIYHAESRRVDVGLQQIELIGASEVTASGIGEFARLVRTEVGLPEVPEYIDDPPAPLNEPPAPYQPNVARRSIGPLPKVPGFFGPLRTFLAPTKPELPEIPELSKTGLQLLGCLLEGNQIDAEFEAQTGHALTDRIRRLGITLFIEEQHRGNNR